MAIFVVFDAQTGAGAGGPRCAQCRFRPPPFENQTRAPLLAESSISVEVFSSDFDFPWAIAPLSDRRFLVTERGGTLQIVDADGARLGELSGVPNSVAIQQGGLLDVAVSSTGIV